MDILGNRGSGSLDDHHQSMFAEVIVLMAAAFFAHPKQGEHRYISCAEHFHHLYNVCIVYHWHCFL